MELRCRGESQFGRSKTEIHVSGLRSQIETLRQLLEGMDAGMVQLAPFRIRLFARLNFVASIAMGKLQLSSFDGVRRRVPGRQTNFEDLLINHGTKKPYQLRKNLDEVFARARFAYLQHLYGLKAINTLIITAADLNR